LYDIDNPRLRQLVIRKNAEDLKDWEDRAMVMYSGMGAKFTGKPLTIEFPSGAKIVTGHLKDDKAYTKYQGHEYQRMLIEELNQIPREEHYLKLISSCRSTIPGLPAKIFATTNPGGVGHTWVKKRFVDPSRPMSEFRDLISGRSRVYIPATVDDNPTLMQNDPDYVRFLESLPPDLKAQWRYGSWETQKVKGAYFADDIAQAQKEDRICELAFLPYDQVDVWWDLGVNDVQVAWFGQLKGDQIRLIDLAHDNSKGFDYYLQMLREKGYKYGTMYLPHDGNKRSPDSLRTFSDALKGAGYNVVVIPRTTDKNRDIQTARTIFPRCWFNATTCAEGLEALTNYRRNWNEERGAFEDHPYHDWSSNFADGFQALAVSLPKPRSNLQAEAYKTATKEYISDPNDFSPLTPINDGYKKAEEYSRQADLYLNSL